MTNSIDYSFFIGHILIAFEYHKAVFVLHIVSLPSTFQTHLSIELSTSTPTL
jgi:hypothetical protein